MEQQIETLIKDIHERVTDIGRRTTRIEEQLSEFATKDDLKPFATKDGLGAFATKDDLKAFATKDDLKAFATKDDLKAFATKDDLKAFATKDDITVFPTRDEMYAAIKAEGELTRAHFDAVAERIEARVTVIAEGHTATTDHVDRTLVEVNATLRAHDSRITRLESESMKRRRPKS